jgi:tetratricopeptide (TPR) repeat protein
LQELKTPEREHLLDSLERVMLELHPADASVFEALGNRRKASNQEAEALNWYKKSLAVDPKNQALLEEVIVNSFEEGAAFEEVATYTAMGVEEFPESAEFWFYEGVVRASLKKDSLAVIGLETALRLNADKNPQLSQVAYGTLGNSLFNLGDQTAAFTNFDKALALNPNDEQVLNNYAYFLSLAKVELDKALSMAERVVKKHPKNATYLDTLAWVLFQRKNYADAARNMEEVLRIDPNPSGVMLEHYGDILYHLNRLPEAISWWKKAQESPEGSDKLALKIQTSTYHD